ncbi:MAG: ATP-binding protein [Planctomycetes bacterium]|nr:ATP-binding protein [Planctomycetota bacterium]
MILQRTELLREITDALRQSPVVFLVGPRQCGKTTLARSIAEESGATFLDLEHPADAARLANPLTALEPLRGLVVIDEAQLQPSLFPTLRVLADRTPSPAQFLLLGSASAELVSNVSESLAGRIHFVHMSGFNLGEVGATRWRELWHRGGFPRSLLAASDEASFKWREDFLTTFLERDLRRLGVLVAPDSLRRLWMMIAHCHGQVMNMAEIGRSLGQSHTTVRRHLDILAGALVLRQLQPWYEDISKRQVKSPKIYIRDSGVLHTLLGLPSSSTIESHPKLGSSWEGFVAEHIIQIFGERNCTFWATQAGAELDLLVSHRGRRYGFEVKYADAPRTTKSMHIAIEALKLSKLYVIYPGDRSFALSDSIEAIGIHDLDARATQLKKSGDE